MGRVNIGQKEDENPQGRNFMMQGTAAPKKYATWPSTQCNIVCQEYEHSTELPGFTP